MPNYSGTALQNVVDQINKDNPQLPSPINTTDFIFGIPKALDKPVAGRNTSIRVTAKRTGTYVDAKDLTYTRISLAYLYRSLPLTYSKYIDQLPAITPAIYLASVNKRYGLNLEASGMTLPTWQPNEGGVAKALVALPTNLMYIDSVPLTWIATKKSVADQIPAQTAGLTVLAAGVKPQASSDNVVDFMTYAGDFSAFKDKLSTYAALTTIANDQDGKALIKYMGLVSGLPLNLAVAATTRNGMTGVRAIQYALPNAAVPEANSTDYNHVAVVTLPAAGGWFAGRFLLHFNA
jgi:hypothetical protein